MNTTTRPVYLWTLETANLPLETVNAWTTVLNEEECRKADAFFHNRDRRDYVAAHALVRALLATIGKHPPASWQWAPDRPAGKPRLIVPDNEEWCFNISHCDGLVAAVLAHGIDVGVDVERLGRVTIEQGMIRLVLSPGQAADLPPEDADGNARDLAFMRTWVRKEAVSKAVGLGLSLNFPTITFEEEPWPHVCLDGKPWDLWDAQPAHGHVLAVCAERRETGYALNDLDRQTLNAEELSSRLGMHSRQAQARPQ